MSVPSKLPVLPVIIGPTASGKTALAVALARQINGEIISADSRQVYRGMTIGTGKDYGDYTIDNQHINYHLIDVAAAGEKYDVARFQADFRETYREITERGKQPILCGGTGLYVEAVLRNFDQFDAPGNEPLRQQLETKTTDELLTQLQTLWPQHSVDTSSRKRIIRGIEKAVFREEHPTEFPTKENASLPFTATVFCLNPTVEARRQKITQRLRQRLDNEGLIGEVFGLLQSDLTAEQLLYYGLEYKFITEYLQGKYTYNELFERLNAAIHRFAKRQMTYFRGMEKRGLEIHWLNGDLPAEERLQTILRVLEKISDKALF